MKKKLCLLLAIAPLVLACGNSDSDSLIPSGGTSVEVAAAAEVLKTAIAAEADSGRLGIQLSDFNFGLTVSVDETQTDGSVSGATSHEGGTITVSNGSLFVGVAGITDEDATAFEGAINLKADVAEKITTTTASIDTSLEDVEANLYVKDKNVYADLSNENFVTLVNSLPVNDGKSVGLTAGKYLYSGVISDTSFPLINSETLTQIQGIGAQVGEWVKQNATSFTAVSYTDGSFGISGSLTKADLAPLFGITSESTSSSQSEMSEIYENLVLSKFSLGLVFSATGLEDLKFEFEASTSFGETDGYTIVDGSSESYVIDHTSAFEISANLSFDLAFLSGSEVVITFPTDLDAYTLVNSAQ